MIPVITDKNPKLDSKYFYKEYHLNNLLDEHDDITRRINQINNLSTKIDCLPQTKFIFNPNIILYKQKYILKKTVEHLNKTDKISILKYFSERLDELDYNGFVHGDINGRNILFDGNKLNLIDLEPALYQFKKGRKTLLFTQPYISCNDLRNFKLTSETDKIGFYFFLKKFLTNMKFGNTFKLMKKRKLFDVDNLYPISEKELVKLKYEEIFKLII